MVAGDQGVEIAVAVHVDDPQVVAAGSFREPVE